jgi:hemerythrin-like domain-containing protein
MLDLGRREDAMTIEDELRVEHDHLMVGVESLRHTGDLIGTVPDRAAQEAGDRALRFLHDHVIPHARAEEDLLYPAVAEVLGTPQSTLTMARDHAEIGLLTGQLERALEENDEPMTRRLLYGLYHVIKLHFAKEEEIYLPLLAELDEATATGIRRHLHLVEGGSP